VVARPARGRTLRLAFLAGGLSVLGSWQHGHAKETRFACRNPSSGATWDIKVDDQRSLADSFPARITNISITWHDTRHGGFYELDRRTGALTVRYASSTGGYALHDVCQMAR
jgi:hypothetical protein